MSTFFAGFAAAFTDGSTFYGGRGVFVFTTRITCRTSPTKYARTYCCYKTRVRGSRAGATYIGRTFRFAANFANRETNPTIWFAPTRRSRARYETRFISATVTYRFFIGFIGFRARSRT